MLNVHSHVSMRITFGQLKKHDLCTWTQPIAVLGEIFARNTKSSVFKLFQVFCSCYCYSLHSVDNSELFSFNFVRKPSGISSLTALKSPAMRWVQPFKRGYIHWEIICIPGKDWVVKEKTNQPEIYYVRSRSVYYRLFIYQLIIFD